MAESPFAATEMIAFSGLSTPRSHSITRAAPALSTPQKKKAQRFAALAIAEKDSI